MDYKKLITILGFTPKEHTAGIFTKKYPQHNGYYIDVNFDSQSIDYNIIVSDSKTTQNFSQPENFVVLECVDRLLTKGYSPQNITLEKTWSAGHGTSGRLDICVTRDDGTEYLLIECKTYGKEFDKELAKMNKDGGQLFTYFKFSNKADIIMLYTSEVQGNKAVCQSEAVKIEDNYRTGDVKDFYKAWNKKTHQNIVWGNLPYNSDARKSFTKKDLRELDEQGSKKIFNEFASILRKHSVSDKPNAFNKIFNLFLAKLFDEAKKESDELEFHWREDDNAVDFQVRLINLHKDGLYAFLQKEIEGIHDADFGAITSQEELQEKKKKILKFNNVFAIKDVLDDASFDENQRVLKDVVQLLEKYQIRYPRKQQHLSDFFELLLTTGLKQEVGQYFTPPPITKFIVRSLPIKQMIEKEINKEVPELPAIIDYAAGSGHFITEAMEEYQDIINGFTKEKIGDFYPKAKKQIAAWQADPYEWAAKYVYGVEKDYRLVKVAKVGCYFYGDGVAQIIHGDGLDNFATSKTYKGLLKENTNLEDSAKAKFSLVLSNPPYSVSDCKDDLEYIGAQNIFTLYSSFSDKSKEIECLFVERTKQLLKDDGIAAVILPSSILSNAGIYTKTREIILQYFDIVAIAELGGGTFMATSTNTVTLFLKRRNNQTSRIIKNYVTKFSIECIDNTINRIEKPVSKYVSYVWEGISFDDYVTLLKKSPNKAIQECELYNEYRKKIKAKTDKEFWNIVLERESEKLYYFLLTYTQTVVLVKSGEKDAEKRFLGYEFSNRRGNEGIHAVERGKTVDECTQLFDVEQFENPNKASTYIYQAFNGDFDSEISENMQKNVFRTRLVDMLNFDRVDFEKSISTVVKKKVKIESQWEQIKIENSLDKIVGVTPKIEEFNIITSGKYPVVTQEVGVEIAGYTDSLNPITDLPIVLFGDHSCAVKYIDYPFFRGADGTVLLKPKSVFESKYYYFVLCYIVSSLLDNTKYERHNKYLKNLYIPLPPKEIQKKIVDEIEQINIKSDFAIKSAHEINSKIDTLLSNIKRDTIALDKIAQYANESIKIEDITLDSYITTDNMLQNKMGVTPFAGNPNIGYITKFQQGDILISNIRPYLKKIWLSSFDGGCSKDVLVIRSVNMALALPRFVYYMLRRDDFFNYVMEDKKGIKMPRGDKETILKYRLMIPSIEEQQKIIAQIEALEAEIAKAQQIIDNAPAQKAAILKKYL